jgi:two-component system sensor histidine kinase BaeS
MRILLSLVAAVLVGLALFELTMQPSSADRAELAGIFIVMAAVSGLAAAFLPALARRSSRLVITLFALSLVSLLVAALGITIAANRMFFSNHDLTLVLVVLGFGLLAAVAFALSASRSLTSDLERMADTARDVAGGDLTVRTGVDRSDEIGVLAMELDDMTAELQAMRETRDTEDRRRREFFAAVSHDLRTPLASMQVAVEALRDGVVEDPDRYLASVQADVEVLGALVDDLFLLSRIQAGDVSLSVARTDLTEVVDETLEVLRPAADTRRVALSLVAPERVVLDTSAEAVGRALRNIVDNAILHAPPESTVTVEVSAKSDARIVVRDIGEGFDESFISVAFESFSRSDGARSRNTGGAGLGLAIAKGLIESLGGSIWAEPGPGGCVGLSLPSSNLGET